MREVREEGRMMTSGVEVEELRQEEWRGAVGKQKVVKKKWRTGRQVRGTWCVVVEKMATGNTTVQSAEGTMWGKEERNKVEGELLMARNPHARVNTSTHQLK